MQIFGAVKCTMGILGGVAGGRVNAVCSRRREVTQIPDLVEAEALNLAGMAEQLAEEP